jgi:hypothetical protein
MPLRLEQRPLREAKQMLRVLVAGIIALAVPFAALAGAIAEVVTRDVQANGTPVAQGQRLVPQTAITTGPGAQVHLRFDDGMQIVLHEQSLLRIVDFRHSASGVTDRAVFELLRGAARVVTGKVALANPKQFFFRTPQSQFTVERPADFSIALVNPAYVTVHAGTVLSSNGWGTVALGAGTTSTVATSAAAPAAISVSSLPATASAALSNLSVAVAAPGSTAAGVGALAVGGAAFPAPILMIGVGAAVAAGAVIAAQSNDDTPSQPAATPNH